MNRYLIEKNIPKACDTIRAVYKSEEVKKSVRSKMASFGAAVLMSGPLSALAYYSKNDSNVVGLIAGMYDKRNTEELVRMFEEHNTSRDVDELIIKSISLKLALNLYIKPDEDGVQDQNT